MEQKVYHAGASNECLDILRWIELHPAPEGRPTVKLDENNPHFFFVNDERFCMCVFGNADQASHL